MTSPLPSPRTSRREHEKDALRSLDVATRVLSAEQHQRAAAVLERILTTSEPARLRTSGAERSDARPVRHPLRHPVRRRILVGAAVLAATATTLTLQGLRSDDAAYASWTPLPTAVDARDLSAAEATCRREVRTYDIALDQARVLLSERRGDHVVLLFHTDDPDLSASCLARNTPGSGQVEDVQTGMGGSSGPALPAPPQGFTQGAIGQYPGASITDGAAGADVRAVTIHAGAFEVEATVEVGRYAAWWPGPAFADLPVQPSGRGGPEPILTYDLTLVDGSVLRDVQPTRPA